MNKNDKSQNTEDAFIMEVNEELKNDKLRQIWEKYGLYIITIVVVALTAAVSFETIKNWYDKKHQDLSDTYSVAVALQNQGKYSDGVALLNKLKEKAGNNIYGQLAILQEANIMFEQEKFDEASALLQAFIDDNETQQALREVAIIKLASYKLETSSFEDIEKMLNPLITEQGNWTSVAQEVLAMSALKNKNIEKAKEIYGNIIANASTPEDLKSRAQDMLLLLSE